LLCVWINVDANAEYNPPPFEPIASFFGNISFYLYHHYHYYHYHHYYHYYHYYHYHHYYHYNHFSITTIITIITIGIWHEHKRGAHKGLHEFTYYSNYILLLNVYARGGDTYKSHMPPDAAIIDNDSFRKDISLLAGEKIANAKRLQLKIISYTSTSGGISCDEVCSNIGNTHHIH